MFAGGWSLVRLAYLAGPVVTLATGTSLVYWIRRHYWDQRGVRWFVGLLLVGGLWVSFLFVHVLVSDPAVQRWAVIGQSVGAVLSVAGFVPFASAYTGRDFHRRLDVRLLLGGSVLGFALLALTNPLHRLAWRSITHVTEPFPYAVIEPGAGGVVLLAVLIGLNGYCWAALVNHLLSTGGGSGVQLLLVLLGAMSIAVAQLVGMLGLAPADGLNHAAYGTVPFVVFATFGLFQFDLLDVLPVARSAVVEHLDDAVLVLDEHDRVVDANRAARRLWPAIETGGRTDFESACPTLAAHVASLEDGVPEQVTLTVDGADRHYSVNTTTITEGATGDAGWHVVLLRDVTELEHSRWQLEKQNERLDQVASTVSHDLRNPLNVASGHVETLALRVEEWDLDPEERRQASASLSKTQASLERMEDIVTDVLTIAREGTAVEQTESVTLGAVAREAWNNLDTREATLTVREDGTLQADRSRLLSIFENLFRNAVEHGTPDVTVTVSLTAGGFTVSDDGPGIPSEHRDGVFEYGYTTADGGTGLGLSIVRTMAESHGWTVALDDGYEGGGPASGSAASRAPGRRRPEGPDRQGISPPGR